MAAGNNVRRRLNPDERPTLPEHNRRRAENGEDVIDGDRIGVISEIPLRESPVTADDFRSQTRGSNVFLKTVC